MKWILLVTLEAEDKNEAASKLVNKVPFMLVNGFEEDGSAQLWLIPGKESEGAAPN